MGRKQAEAAEKVRHRLQTSVFRKIAALLAAGILMFIAWFFIITGAINENNAVKNADMLETACRSLYERNRQFLVEEETLRLCRQILARKAAAEQLDMWFYRFDSGGDVKNQIIVTSKAGDVLYTSFSENIFGRHSMVAAPPSVNIILFCAQKALQSHDCYWKALKARI